MTEHTIGVGDTVTTRKPHPCGGKSWQVLRTGADVKLRCLNCGRVVMLDYNAFLKRIK